MTTTLCSTPSNGNVTSNSSTSINGKSNTPGPRPSATLHQGFVAALKDTFGFIETISHDKEIFFHFRYLYKLRISVNLSVHLFRRKNNGN